MRIIAGEFRGRRIDAPPGQDTRPMLDRVREAVFSSLGDRVDEAAVLDLFAGTGSLGLEALSRGARSALLVERDARALRHLEANVAALAVEDRARVRRGDALRPTSWGAPEERFDLIFLDPPYPLVRESRGRASLLAALEELARERLADEGTIVLHTPTSAPRAEEFPADLEARGRTYGRSAIWFLAREPE